ncbi:MAG: hypothetical protein WA705_07690 [Candidatus Ozemobacteraceae bacterium]
MNRWHYIYAGLRVRSELSIPEWAIFEENEPFDSPEVTISLAGAANPASGNIPIVTANEYHFHVPEVGSFRVSNGCEIVITPALEARSHEMRLFLLGSAWGALCYQRGVLALHSSAVQVGDGAVIFCGPSGSGKSTVAAWLISQGFNFVGDDLCRFETSPDGIPMIYPSAPRLKLWSEALKQLKKDDKGLERDHFRHEKYHVNLTGGEKTVAMPLLGIFLLEWGDIRLTRLTGKAALSRFVAMATYRSDLLEPMGRIAAQWEACAVLLRRVPVWEFRRPQAWSVVEESMNALMTHFQSRELLLGK